MTKQWIYGMPPEQYGQKLKKRLIVALAMIGATLVLNIALAIFRTDETHIWFLLINILSDIVCGVYFVYDLSFHYAPQRRLLKLNSKMKETISGEITQIETTTTRYANLNCYCVMLGNRRTFLPAGTLQLEVGSKVELTLSGNVILEVAQ